MYIDPRGKDNWTEQYEQYMVCCATVFVSVNQGRRRMRDTDHAAAGIHGAVHGLHGKAASVIVNLYPPTAVVAVADRRPVVIRSQCVRVCPAVWYQKSSAYRDTRRTAENPAQMRRATD